MTAVHRRSAVVAALLTFLATVGSPIPAAGGPAPSSERVVTWVLLTLLPHDVGALISEAGGDLDLGWTIQVPLLVRHRIAASLDWSPTSYDHRVRGRLGYRVATRYPFFGFGGSLDRSGATWSPEIGVRLAFDEGERRLDQASGAPHILARADLAPKLDALRGVSVLVGWSLF